MIPLTFNADDFGLSRSVNRSIAACARAGLLKSASLLVTHPAAEDAARTAGGLDEPIGLGLHFCLTSGRAVSPPSSIPLLAGPDGRFKHGFLSLARLLLRSGRRDEAFEQVRREFGAQTRRFEELLPLAGRCPADHLDSHQHFHVFPPAAKLLAEYARSKGLVLRVPAEPVLALRRVLRPPFLFHAKGFAKKKILDHFIEKSRREPEFPLSAPVYFGIVDSGHMNFAAAGAILDLLPKLKKRGECPHSVEINLHPWKVTGEEELVPEEASAADRAFARSPGREEEFDLLIKHAPQIQAKMLDLGMTASRFATPGQNR